MMINSTLRQVGIEPTANRLKAECSTGELLARILYRKTIFIMKIVLTSIGFQYSYISAFGSLPQKSSLDFNYSLLKNNNLFHVFSFLVVHLIAQVSISELHLILQTVAAQKVLQLVLQFLIQLK